MSDVTMPQLGETVTEGTITRWLKQVGDQVTQDEPLFEVSTDKVDSEVPAPAAGYLAEIVVPEGETVEVGARLAVISSDAPAGDGSGASSPPPDPAAEQQTASEPVGGVEEPPSTTITEEPNAPEQPKAPEPAAAVAGEAARDEAEWARMPEPQAPVGGADLPPADGGGANGDGDGAGSGGKVLSPVVRRLINENGLDPSQITGSGAGGRITRGDVLAELDRRKQGGGGRAEAPAQPQASPPAAGAPQAPAPSAPAPAPAPAPAAAPSPAAPAPAPAPAAERRAVPIPPAAQRGDHVVPFSNIRRRTAEHMVRSKATSAHTLVAIEVDYHAIEKVRLPLRDRFKAEEGVSLTYLPFLSRATVDALRDFPYLNASVGDDELVVHGDVNLGIAVDLNFEGLLAPVVQGADGKRLRALAREIADLAARARSRKLTVDDLQGGTFTITNPGPFGTFITAPVINQPQIAILSTDGVKKKPVAIELPDGTDGIAVHPVGILAISFDHRAVDGAYASAFLARLKEIIETRDWSQEL